MAGPAYWRSSAGPVLHPSTFLVSLARSFSPGGPLSVLTFARRFVRRSAKPAAMVGVVGILSLSLVVSTPSNAQAFSDGDLLQKAAPRIAGAVKTIAPVAGPVLAVATSVTPMGWVLKGGYSLVMLAFSTSDLWLPYVTGAFGEGQAQTAPGSFALTNSNWQITDIAMNATGFVVTVKNNGPTAQSGINVTTHIQCKNNTTGAVAAPLGSTNQIPGLSPGQTYSVPRTCGTGSTPIAWAASPPCGFTPPGLAACTVKSTLQGPANLITGGTWSQTTGAFDPRGADVGYQGRSECIDSTGTVSWISGPTISGSAGGVQMPSCEAAGKGHGTGRTQVIAFKPDGTQQPVWDVPVAPSDPSTPMCDPGKSSGGCVLSVELDGKGCEAGNVECENWAEIQKQDPNNTRLKCRFGPYTLPMSACNMLEQAYRIGGAIATELNTDGDPATQDNNNYAGQPVPQPAAPPVTGTVPGAAPAPGASGQTGPNADEKARQCWPQGWAAFNPLEWVLKPLRCAFEPSRDMSQMGQIFREKAKVKAPVSFILAFDGMQGPSGGGCPNWTINLPGFSKNVVCDSSFTAAILGVRGPLFGLVASAMVWPLLRGIWYASIPILRVTPTGGK